MKQNAFWLIAATVILLGVGGFFTLTADNKLPGIVMIFVVLVAIFVTFKESAKQ